MSTVVEFSDEPKFSIQTVCAQTGIRPVTLRAWERRHELLNPHRSPNRYRLYSERDIAILRWVKNRVDGGIAISSVVGELKSMNKNGIWPDAIPGAVPGQSHAPAAPPEQYARQLFQALIGHQEAQASDLLREVHATFDLLTICTQIITPALVGIGDAWYRGEIRITTEHFASAVIRGRLLSLLQTYPTRRGSAYILLGGAPSEQHEIGSLMMAVMLRAQGFRVEYLGPDIPLEDLIDYAGYEHPQMILLTATLEPAGLELVHLQEKLNRHRPAPLFVYAGRAFDASPELRSKVAGTYLGAEMGTAIQTVRSLLPQEKNS